MSIRYFILGLLTRKPMTGYDVKTSLEDLSWLVDVPSYGSLYPALHNLLEEGMVNVSVVPGDGKPSRKVYSITEAGTQVLQTWIHRPIETDISQKTFVMRLLLANNFSREGLIAYLKQRHTRMTTHLAALESRIEINTAETSSEAERFAADYGLVIASAEIHWLEDTLARLAENAH